MYAKRTFFSATTSNLNLIWWNFHHRFTNGCTLQQWYGFGKIEIWLLMTSPQSQRLRGFWLFFKKATYLWAETCLGGFIELPFLVPKCPLLNFFWWSSLNKEILFWFFCRWPLETHKMIKKCWKSLF